MKRVLFLLDLAGVFAVVRHFYNKESNNNSELLYHKKNNTSSKINERYGDIPKLRFRDIILTAIKVRKQFDIIHISSAEILVPLFRILGKKVVLSYHGSDVYLKKRSTNPIRILCRSFANVITYNRDDMLEKIITIRNIPKVYLRNMIDTNTFKPLNKERKGWLSFISDNLDTIKTTEEILKIQPNCEIVNTSKKRFDYTELNNLFNKYEGYIDLKINYGKWVKAWSNTGLQALSSGCRVYNSGEFYDKLPNEFTPSYIIETLRKIYDIA